MGAWLQSASRVALGLTVVLIPFRLRLTLQARPVPPIYGDFTDLLLFFSEIVLYITLGLWWAGWLSRPGTSLDWGPLVLSLPLLGLTLIAAASSALSLDPALSVFNGLKLLLLYGFYLMLVNEPGLWTWLVPAILVQGYLQSATGLGQILAQRSLGLQAVGELLLDPTWSGVSIVWAEGQLSLRAYGLTDHPNILAGCLAFGLLITAGAYLQVSERWRPAAAVLMAINLLGLILTYSRAAWLALFAGALLLTLLALRHLGMDAFRRLFILGTGGALLAAPILFHNRAYLGARANVITPDPKSDIQSRAIHERLVLNRAANQVFADSPLTGTGLSTFPQALLAINPDLGFDYQPPHLVLLAVAAETGLFGAFFYAIVIVAPWVALLGLRRRTRISPALITTSAALAGLTVISLLDYYPWLLAPGRLWSWLIWGLWAGAYQSLSRSRQLD